MGEAAGSDEAVRLEQLWSGQFGDAWSDRNIGAYDTRGPFWDALLTRLAPRRVLEVGCNVGGNLRHIAPHLEPASAYGVDVNRHSLGLIRDLVPDANVLVAPARELPFRDAFFDLTFTVGVLIHHPDEALVPAMRELARCSAQWVLVVEIFAETETEIVHRGVERAIFKRDYGALFLDAVPEAALADSGFLGRDEGFDDLTWWLFQKETP